MAVLYKQDQAVLEAVRPLVKKVLAGITKEDVTGLAPFSPYPATKESHRVISHLGDIEEFINRPEGLELAARFTYKILIAAKIAMSKEIGF